MKNNVNISYDRCYIVNSSDNGEKTVLLSKDLTVTEKLVWLTYRSTLKFDNRVCFQSDIISSLGLTPTFVSLATKKLVGFGFLEKEGKEYFLPKQFAFRLEVCE